MSESPQRPRTPALDRIHLVHEQSQKVGEFMDWLAERGYTIAVESSARNEGHRNCLEPAIINRNRLLHEFFEVDGDEEARERDLVLAYMRELQTSGSNPAEQQDGPR